LRSGLSSCAAVRAKSPAAVLGLTNGEAALTKVAAAGAHQVPAQAAAALVYP
jgi:hypothetical protein